MNEPKNDGGSVFPGGGLTVRDCFALQAPTPSDDDVGTVLHQERMANPHNDNYKPRRRGRLEIECSLRYKWADVMLKARDQ